MTRENQNSRADYYKREAERDIALYDQHPLGSGDYMLYLTRARENLRRAQQLGADTTKELRRIDLLVSINEVCRNLRYGSPDKDGSRAA